MHWGFETTLIFSFDFHFTNSGVSVLNVHYFWQMRMMTKEEEEIGSDACGKTGYKDNQHQQEVKRHNLYQEYLPNHLHHIQQQVNASPDHWLDLLSCISTDCLH